MEFTSENIHPWLDQADDDTLNALKFGVIGIDRQDLIRQYNLCESRYSLLTPEDVIGRPLFTEVALCMNNPLVGGRIRQAREKSQQLDVVIDYVLAFKSGAGPVQIRLLSSTEISLSYLLIHRLTA